MIFTVTLNPAVDKTVVIPDFKAGTVNRIQCIRQDALGGTRPLSSDLRSSIIIIRDGGAPASGMKWWKI